MLDHDGSVHLVELRGTGQFFAMKAMDKSVMLNRNKVLKLVNFDQDSSSS